MFFLRFMPGRYSIVKGWPRRMLRVRENKQFYVRLETSSFAGLPPIPNELLMKSLLSSQSPVEGSVQVSILPRDAGFHRVSPAVERLRCSVDLGPRRTGYGLPCVKCKTYYAADLSACPVCKTEERVLPTSVVYNNTCPRPPESFAPAREGATLKGERGRFLREFGTKVLNFNGQIDPQIDAPAGRRCSLEARHKGEFELATVCQNCYAHLQQRVDLLEAALHMDLKETTQVVYDAVWSEPSDPSKTYQNAAQAVLGKLHRRAGISAMSMTG